MTILLKTQQLRNGILRPFLSKQKNRNLERKLYYLWWNPVSFLASSMWWIMPSQLLSSWANILCSKCLQWWVMNGNVCLSSHTTFKSHDYSINFPSNSIGISVQRAPPHIWFWKSSSLASIEMTMVKVQAWLHQKKNIFHTSERALNSAVRSMFKSCKIILHCMSCCPPK